VLGPAGDVVFSLVGRDEAGNTATARLTITLSAKPKPALTIADARSVFTSGLLKTGLPQVVGPSLALTVIATYPEAITGIASPDLLVTGGAFVASVPVSSANGRVWTFAVTLASALVGPTHDGDVWTFAMADAAGTTVARGLATAASDTARIVIDSSAPVGPSSPVISSFTAVVGMPFFAPLPVGMFVDSLGGHARANPYATLAESLDIVSATPDVSVGLVVTAGKQGAAYVSGSAATKPIATWYDVVVIDPGTAGDGGDSGEGGGDGCSGHSVRIEL
jgi:hypothetical protein